VIFILPVIGLKLLVLESYLNPSDTDSNNAGIVNGKAVVSYGAEAWTLTKKEEQTALIFERKNI